MTEKFTSIKSQKYGHLNNNRMMSIPTDMTARIGKSHKAAFLDGGTSN